MRSPETRRGKGRLVRKRVLVILGCLVVGVVVNVLVAWGCALRIKSTWSTTEPNSPFRFVHQDWPMPVPANWPPDPDFVTKNGGSGLSGLHLTTDTYEVSKIEYFASVNKAGWPVVAMRWDVLTELDYPQRQVRYLLNDGTWRGLWLGGMPVSARLHWDYQRYRLATTIQGSREGVPVPLRPLWPGFAVNTAIYGAFAWFVMFAPGVARRARRLKREACVKCGYDLRGGVAGGMCPECGTEKSGVKTGALTAVSKQTPTLPAGE